MMATGFLGYVLPWGQMSFWGATVITGLFGAIPFIGPDLQTWLLGGPAVDNATLNRFFSLHYLLPFVIAGLVIVHIWAFHTTGNNNPTGVEVRRGSKAEAEKDTLPFWPYFVIKDLFALAIVLTIFFAIVGFMPNYFGEPDNYIEANPLKTPTHIVPEWYFLPFYAILRAFTSDVWVVQIAGFVTGGIIDAKFFGVMAMFGAIFVMALVPWLDTSSVRSGSTGRCSSWWFYLLVIDFVVLMWVRLAAGRATVLDHLADRRGLLVRLLPGHPADPGGDRKAAAAAGDDRGRLQRTTTAPKSIRPSERGQTDEETRTLRRRPGAGAGPRRRLRAGPRSDPYRGHRVPVGRAVRQLRPVPAAARAAGLHRGLQGLPRPALRADPHAGRRGRGRAARGPGPRLCRAVRSLRPRTRRYPSGDPVGPLPDNRRCRTPRTSA